MVRAERSDVERRQQLGGLARGDARGRLGRLVEREQRDDGEARDTPDRLDRILELLQVGERLDEEHVCSATFEDARLLGMHLAPNARGRRLAERADRPRDEHRLAEISRASRASLIAAELIRSRSSSR